MAVINYRDARPIYEQISDHYKNLILSGVMEADEQMPSVRNLAMELATNPNTIQKAFAELDRRGITRSVPGKGSFISQEAKQVLAGEHREELKELEKYLNNFRLAGIGKEEILGCVEKVYGGDEE